MLTSDISNEDLLATFNRWSTKTVKKFETRKVGEERLGRLLAELGITLVQASDPDFRMEPKAAKEVPAIRWTARYEAPGKTSEINEPGSWLEAANWLRGILEATRPEASYDTLVNELRIAQPELPIMIHDDKRTYSVLAIDPNGAAIEIRHPEPVQVEFSIAPKEPTAKAPKKREKREFAVCDGASQESNGKLELIGKKADLFQMLLREGGMTEKEGCDALGWKACGATLGRLMTAAAEAGYKTEKRKDEASGRLRYYVSAA